MSKYILYGFWGIIVFGCIDNNTNTQNFDEIAKTLNLTKEEFDSNYELKNQYKIHSLNTEVYSFLSLDKVYLKIIYDNNNRRYYDNYIDKPFENYYQQHNGRNFHPYRINEQNYNYIEEYLNNSVILKDRTITKKELDSLIIYPIRSNELMRINNLYDLENAIDEIKKVVKRRESNDERREFILNYLDDGYAFLTKKISSPNCYIFQGSLFISLIEINHQKIRQDSGVKNLKYRLKLYIISSKSPNLYYLLNTSELQRTEIF